MHARTHTHARKSARTRERASLRWLPRSRVRRSCYSRSALHARDARHAPRTHPRTHAHPHARTRATHARTFPQQPRQQRVGTERRDGRAPGVDATDGHAGRIHHHIDFDDAAGGVCAAVTIAAAAVVCRFYAAALVPAAAVRKCQPEYAAAAAAAAAAATAATDDPVDVAKPTANDQTALVEPSA